MPPDIHELSDEDFLKQAELDFAASVPQPTEEVNPLVESQEPAPIVEAPTEATALDNLESGSPEGEVVTPPDEGSAVPTENNVTVDSGAPASSTTNPVEKAESTEVTPADSATAEQPKEAPATTQDVDFKAAYEQIMAPFKANGSMMQVKSPEEAVRLMQMGANYTQRMQELQPQRKLMMMLERNGLLDENKLSFLIDLEKGNPEAVRKHLREKKLDPMDLDVETEPAYVAGAHRVDDATVAFKTTMDEIISVPGGMDTLKAVQGWDSPSIDKLAQSPDVLHVIHEQRVNGTYDIVAAEVNRQRMLGNISPSTPFILAYQQVGSQLAESGVLKPAAAKSVPAPAAPAQKPAPVAVRPAAAKPAVTNNAKAAAASPVANTPASRTGAKSFAEMSDDEFMKAIPK